MYKIEIIQFGGLKILRNLGLSKFFLQFIKLIYTISRELMCSFIFCNEKHRLKGIFDTFIENQKL